MTRFWVTLVLAALILTSNNGLAAADKKLAIYAAASMTDAVWELARKFEATCACDTSVIIGGSGTLARQIEAGAPAQVFITADPRWIEWLRQKPGFNNHEPVWFATNQLVIIGRSGLTRPITSLAQLESIRFAIGEPLSVPAGAYAKEALKSKGLWQNVKKNAVRTENVRIALAMVNRGAVDTAIVYASDAKQLKNATISKIDPRLHRPIQYGAIAIGEPDKAAQSFLAFLQSGNAKSIVEHHGFQLPAE